MARLFSSIVDGNDNLEGEGIVDRKKQQEAYENYVKQKTPVHNLPVNMTKAFITGGIICTIGQSVLNYCEKMGLDKDISGGWTSMILILLSVVLTALNIYPRIAKWGGAGDSVWSVYKLGAWIFILDWKNRRDNIIIEKAGKVYDTGIAEYRV